MKKYIIGLFILISIGSTLGYFAFKQNMLLDDNVYLDTTASVRNLKILDNTTNILLFSIRHENNLNYSELENVTVRVSDEFDNLRYEALFEEIESSPEMNQATINFEAELRNKQRHISEFINTHKELISANNEFLEASTSNSPINQITRKLSLQSDITSVNINFYRYLENSNAENKQRLNEDIAHIEGMIENYTEDDQTVVYSYIKTLSDIIIYSEESQGHFTAAIDQGTTNALNDFEFSYVNFHNLAIEKANTLRNALSVYGVILLVALMILAFLLRKNYANLEQQVSDRTQEIQQAYTDLQESQEQLIQSEKMASLGEMVAGVAHEINTPLGYVNSNISTIQLNTQDLASVINQVGVIYNEAKLKTRSNKKISSLLSATLKSYAALQNDETIEESQQLLDDSQHGLSEISKLVMSLKDFSRLDRQSTDEVDIHDCINSSLKIATNHIRDNNVDVQCDFGELPNIVCTPSKINQLFLNIITNASQAMKQNGGELRIKTQHNDKNITIAFIDQGMGMDEETSHKMFDPFFTSKPIGEGTGLGMSIAYKIVQSHGGKIQVKSTPDVGTTIAIQLPVKPTN